MNHQAVKVIRKPEEVVVREVEAGFAGEAVCLKVASERRGGAVHDKDVACGGHRLTNLFNGHYKSTNSLLGCAGIEAVDFIHEGGQLFFGDNGEDGGVEGRPRMGAVMWLARFGAPALHFFPEGEPPDFQVIQNFNQFYVKCLVKGNEDCFHLSIKFEAAKIRLFVKFGQHLLKIFCNVA